MAAQDAEKVRCNCHLVPNARSQVDCPVHGMVTAAQVADLVAAGLHPKHLKQAQDALAVQSAISKLATRYDPILVMEVARNWVAYMDRAREINERHSDGQEVAE